MPRQARIDAPGALHHIICRGIDHAMRRLNNRPRKTLGFETPNEVFCKDINNKNNVAFIN